MHPRKFKFFQGQHALDAWRISGEMKVVVKGHNTEALLDFFKQAKDLVTLSFLLTEIC